MDECLTYFRAAIDQPTSVAAWDQWWADNEMVVQQVFPLADYVRLKHRGLLGAKQILQRQGEFPED